MDGTAPLKSVIEEQVSERDRNVTMDKAFNEYHKIYKNPSSKQNEYLSKMRSARPESICNDFEGVQNLLRPDLLSRGVAALSTSAESYLAMRATFSRSLASLTVASYVLGIGDRHLDNFMLDKSSGRCIGIDFGHAFGSATYQLPVPELMAVRLTRQVCCGVARTSHSVSPPSRSMWRSMRLHSSSRSPLTVALTPAIHRSARVRWTSPRTVDQPAYGG